MMELESFFEKKVGESIADSKKVRTFAALKPQGG